MPGMPLSTCLATSRIVPRLIHTHLHAWPSYLCLAGLARLYTTKPIVRIGAARVPQFNASMRNGEALFYPGVVPGFGPPPLAGGLASSGRR